MTLLAARYMTRFRCLAADCPDDCCHGWRVVVDQKHHDLLRDRLPAGEHAAALRRIEEGGDRGRHALVVLDERGRCAFLDGGGLCSVQARFGEDHLPDGCAMFPRVVARLGKSYELAGSVSCPEVARLALADADALEMAPADRTQFARGLVTHRVEPDGAEAFAAVRGRMLELLSLPGYPLASRLFFIACQAATDHVIPDDLHAELEAFRPGTPFAMSVVREVLRLPPLRDVVAGLRPAALEGDAAAMYARYASARCPPELDEWLGRYARHYVMREWSSRSPSLPRYVTGLLVRVAVLRFLVAAHAEPSFAALVRAVVRLTRVLEHDRPLAEELVAELEAQGMTSLEHAACLARF